MSAPPPHDWHAPIIASMVKAYGRYRNPTYIEIGVDRGFTVQAVAPFADRVHAVDVTFENVAVELGTNVSTWETDSDSFFLTFSQSAFAPTLGKADVVFIDGDHDGGQVRKDLANALRVIHDDGTVILHDTHPLEPSYMDWCGTAYEARLEAQGDPDLSTWTIPLFPGLTFVSKRCEPFKGQA